MLVFFLSIPPPPPSISSIYISVPLSSHVGNFSSFFFLCLEFSGGRETTKSNATFIFKYDLDISPMILLSIPFSLSLLCPSSCFTFSIFCIYEFLLFFNFKFPKSISDSGGGAYPSLEKKGVRGPFSVLFSFIA